jgi:IS5 family transposase
MHEPSDSALLWDAVRVMTRLLRQAAALPGAPALQWRDRQRLAKKRSRAIEYSRGKDKRRQLYRELIAATRVTQAALQDAVERLAGHCQFRRPWYARCVGGTAARVGRSFARPLCGPL